MISVDLVCCIRPLTAAFLAQSVCLDDTTVKFEIWDTAGQERYHSLAPMYYRGAQAAIVVFDITKPVKYPSTYRLQWSFSPGSPLLTPAVWAPPAPLCSSRRRLSELKPGSRSSRDRPAPTSSSPCLGTRLTWPRRD